MRDTGDPLWKASLRLKMQVSFVVGRQVRGESPAFRTSLDSLNLNWTLEYP